MFSLTPLSEVLRQKLAFYEIPSKKNTGVWELTLNDDDEAYEN